jgi:hypothetical protein
LNRIDVDQPLFERTHVILAHFSFMIDDKINTLIIFKLVRISASAEKFDTKATSHPRSVQNSLNGDSVAARHFQILAKQQPPAATIGG